MTDLTTHPWFFCGIGGSGMLPLALILRGMGAVVSGSDRAFDAGRTPEKFAWIQSLGLTLHPQDGSGLTSPTQTLVASAAIEDTVPEVLAAKALGAPRLTRAQLLSRLFNAAPKGIAIGGTSGKSTTTGMIGWILTQTGADPTIMNGAVMKNFATPDAPFASARVGQGESFVSEVDESDGSIALYTPAIAVLNNVSLDHKSLEELRALFGAFLTRAQTAIVNADDPESAALAPQNAITFGLHTPAHFTATKITQTPTSLSAQIHNTQTGENHPLTLPIPGLHNLSNALAALAAAHACAIPLAQATHALSSFQGLARRFDITGTSPSGITVIDDFGHNPDKVAATLKTLKAHPGRILAFFQPHGYGPLRQMGAELAQTFTTLLDPTDHVLMCDPVYFGGTVDRSTGSAQIVAQIRRPTAQHLPSREACGQALLQLAKPKDRIVIMGARDDTLTLFAKELLARLP